MPTPNIYIYIYIYIYVCVYTRYIAKTIGTRF